MAADDTPAELHAAGEPDARTMAALEALDQAVAEIRETHTGPASSLYLRGWADAAKHLRRLLEPADEPDRTGE